MISKTKIEFDGNFETDDDYDTQISRKVVFELHSVEYIKKN